MNIILPSGNEIDSLLRLLDLIKDPEAVKKTIADLKKATKAHNDALETASAQFTRAAQKEQEVSGTIAGFSARDEALNARDAKLAEREAKIAAAETDLKKRQEEFQQTSTRDLPSRLAAVAAREKAVQAMERQLHKQADEIEKERGQVAAAKSDYEGKLAQIKALAG